MRGFIFCREDSGLKAISDLGARSIMFGEPYSTVTFEAQRLLASSGITQLSLSRCDYIESSPSSEFNKGGYFSRSSESLQAVMRGDFDAGVGLQRQVEQTPFRNRLRALAEFECPSPFWAATAKVDATIAAAFITAMERLSDPLVLRSLPEDPQQPHGFVRTAASEYLSVEMGQEEVRRFLGTTLNASTNE